MNSCYGKTVQKPVKSDHKNVHESEFESYYYKIIECSKLNNGGIFNVKIVNQIDNQFNFSLSGVQALSMPKRIMKEVMCLAFLCVTKYR